MRYWIRHDQPAVSPGTCYGWADVELAVSPQQTAARLRGSLPNGLPVFTSPLQRCRLLAEQLHEQPVVLADLREVHFGRWEHLNWDQIPRAELDAWAAAPFGYGFPEGELIPDFIQRVSATVLTLPEHCIVVTHGGVIRLAYHLAEGQALSDAFALPVPLGSVHVLPA